MCRLCVKIIFILSIIFVSIFSQKIIHNNYFLYRNISWGNIYSINVETGIYYESYSKFSYYEIPKSKYVMCDTKYKNERLYMENNKFFCWYVFEEKEKPISGWIKVESLNNLKEKNK